MNREITKAVIHQGAIEPERSDRVSRPKHGKPPKSVTLPQASASTTDVPMNVLEALLRDHLADPRVTITAYTSLPLVHEGTNDSTTFFRVILSWKRSASAQDVQTTTWILKHWQVGGLRDSRLGITQSREVLAWEQGWLHPTALPTGVVVPMIGVWRAPDDTEAWLALTDVSTELAAYPRMGLSGDQAISRTQALLARLAYFHALWEQPERQAALQACSWLRRQETYLWDMAPTYARALGRSPHADTPPAASAPPVWEGLSADLDAFLAVRSADERRLWEHLLTDRTALVEGLAAYPQTLLHNDLDDRNIGLRWSDRAATQSPMLDQPDPFVLPGASLVLPNLVLIDWEWMTQGPAALDVANVIQRLPVLIKPGSPIPAAIWSNGLADGYFAHYRAAGGRIMDAAAWRRAHGVALVAQGIVQMPFIHGSLRRAIRGEVPPPQIVGVPEAVIRQQLQAGLPMMEQMEQRVIGEARRWLK
jgi:hypothetical protein